MALMTFPLAQASLPCWVPTFSKTASLPPQVPKKFVALVPNRPSHAHLGLSTLEDLVSKLAAVMAFTRKALNRKALSSDIDKVVRTSTLWTLEKYVDQYSLDTSREHSNP